jgi:endonuclease/exonuclease/phosphatase family metal-dependent hydrolase
MTMTTLAQKGSFRLLSYNIRNGKGMDNVADYDRAVAVFKRANADVIGLQEVDSLTKRSNEVDVLNLLSKKAGMYAVYGAAIDYQGGKYGVGILSKQKPLTHYAVPLPGKEEKRVLLVAEFTGFVIFCTHLSLTEDDRVVSQAIIDSQAARFAKPVYLLGDMNAEPSSAAITAFKSGWRLLSGEAATFPAPVPDKCIDYIFSRNGTKQVVSAMVMDEPVASDHRPVVVELRD